MYTVQLIVWKSSCLLGKIRQETHVESYIRVYVHSSVDNNCLFLLSKERHRAIFVFVHLRTSSMCVHMVKTRTSYHSMVCNMSGILLYRTRLNMTNAVCIVFCDKIQPPKGKNCPRTSIVVQNSPRCSLMITDSRDTIHIKYNFLCSTFYSFISFILCVLHTISKSYFLLYIVRIIEIDEL